MLLSPPGTEPWRSTWLAVGVARLSPRLCAFQKFRFSSLTSSLGSASEYSVAVECDLNDVDGDILGLSVVPEFRDDPESVLDVCSASFDPPACKYPWAKGG
jgi:hypothetical protein